MEHNDRTFNGLDGSFHYIDWGGSGPLTHIAHATGLCAGAYSPMAKSLQAHFHVVGLDFRGHGHSVAPAYARGLKNWEIFYDDLERFFEHLGKPFVAIGHSLGGTASLVVSSRRPELVSALILIEPGIMAPLWRPWVYLAQKTGLSGYVPFVTRASGRKGVWKNRDLARADVYKKGQFRYWADDFIDAFIDEGLKNDEMRSVKLACNPAWEGRCLAMAPCNIWKYVPRLKIPTLVLYGKLSKTFLPSVVRRFRADVPQAKIIGFEQTGHFIPMEVPEKTVEVILNFLSENKIV